MKLSKKIQIFNKRLREIGGRKAVKRFHAAVAVSDFRHYRQSNQTLDNLHERMHYHQTTNQQYKNYNCAAILSYCLCWRATKQKDEYWRQISRVMDSSSDDFGVHT